MTVAELEALSAATFRTEGTDAHTLKGPTRAAEHRSFITAFIEWIKETFVAKVTGSRLITAAEVTKLEAIATPPPSGVKWTVAPAEKPTVTSDDVTQSYTETAAEITVGATPVTIPLKQFTYALAAAGKERTDLVYARYEAISGGEAVGFWRLPGNEVNEGFGSLAPSVPTGALFVRYLRVTDNASTTTATPTIVTLDNTVTQTGANGVKSSGIWSFVYGITGLLTGLLTTAKGTLVAAINELYTNKADKPLISTGVAIKFDRQRIYGTLAAPVTTGFTADFAGAVPGTFCQITHNSPTQPFITTDFKRLGGAYKASVNNFFYLHYIGPNHINYVVTQVLL